MKWFILPIDLEHALHPVRLLLGPLQVASARKMKELKIIKNKICGNGWHWLEWIFLCNVRSCEGKEAH